MEGIEERCTVRENGLEKDYMAIRKDLCAIT